MTGQVTLKCKAVLFDMDGTLVDSTPVVERAWTWWAKRHSLPLEDVLHFSHGRPSISTLEHFLPGRDHTAEVDELAEFEETEIEGILAVPGALEVVTALEASGHPWAIVTSAWRKLAETRVVGAGLPLPRVLVPVDEIRKAKPDPEGFLLAAEKLGVAPEECVVFEDTRPGINAGVSAGMQVVGLLTTFSSEQLRHSPAIRDFRDLRVQSDGEFLEIVVTDHSNQS